MNKYEMERAGGELLRKNEIERLRERVATLEGFAQRVASGGSKALGYSEFWDWIDARYLEAHALLDTPHAQEQTDGR